MLHPGAPGRSGLAPAPNAPAASGIPAAPCRSNIQPSPVRMASLRGASSGCPAAGWRRHASGRRCRSHNGLCEFARSDVESTAAWRSELGRPRAPPQVLQQRQPPERRPFGSATRPRGRRIPELRVVAALPPVSPRRVFGRCRLTRIDHALSSRLRVNACRFLGLFHVEGCRCPVAYRNSLHRFLDADGIGAVRQQLYVASTGADGNACTRTSPCRTFSGALGKASQNGQITALDSSEYGPFTVSQSIAIVANGVTATVSGANSNAITINIPNAAASPRSRA